MLVQEDNKKSNHEKEIKPALLTKSEIEWLSGKKQVSKSFEWKIKSDIKRKLATFESLELPLLQTHGFHLTTNCKELTANSKVTNLKNNQCSEAHLERNMRYNRKWMGRDSNSRPPVCETGILTRLDYPSRSEHQFRGSILIGCLPLYQEKIFL